MCRWIKVERPKMPRRQAGAVVYEMITGDRVFKGDSQASLIASILDSQPRPVSSIEPRTPPALDRVVAKCLAKDPDDRWHSAHDLTDEFQWIAQERTLPAPSAGHHRGSGAHVSSGRGIYTVGAAAVLVIAVIATVVMVSRLGGTSEPASLEVTRMTVALPADTQVVQGVASAAIALSPDGTRLVYAAESAGRTQLYLRELDQFTVTALPGTEGARHPFFSPEGEWVGFFADGLLQRIAVSGGLPLTICEAPVVGHGAAWGPDGTIIFQPGRTVSGLLRMGRPFSPRSCPRGTVGRNRCRVSADGGEPQALTTLDREMDASRHYWPSFLPRSAPR